VTPFATRREYIHVGSGAASMPRAVAHGAHADTAQEIHRKPGSGMFADRRLWMAAGPNPAQDSAG